MATQRVFGIFFQRCVFPQAIKPWQKGLCATAGVMSLGGTTYGLIHAWRYSSPYIEPSLDKVGEAVNTQLDKIPAKLGTLIPKQDTQSKKNIASLVAGSTKFLFGGVYGILSVGTIGYLGKDSLEVYRGVKGTSECCNIVRRAFFYSMRTPIFTGVGFACLWMSAIMFKSGYMDFKEIYTSKKSQGERAN